MTHKPPSLFDWHTVGPALSASFQKLDPRLMVKNPVMFVTMVGAVLTSVGIFTSPTDRGFIAQLAVWLWFTVLFANFAEAVAEGRGRAQAESLRKARKETIARRLRDGREEKVPAPQLQKGDLVVCEAGDLIPADGDVVEGIASVDESAITGESAPVIRESGGDRSAVTAGTRVISDRIVIRTTQEKGNAFLDRMIAMVEGAKRQKTPNEIALTILLAALTFIFLLVCVTLKPLGIYSGAEFSVPVLVALLVCLIPTTSGGLLSAVGISGIDRLIRRNVMATSGRAVEAAGDVDVLLLDKTGTITLGNRMATEFIPAPGIKPERLADCAQLASLADETPEGRSVVLLAAIEKEAAAQRRGRLKVFLGLSAGVGKTYAMLEAAHRARREGRDVVIGYVETHGRAETDALLAGLPLIPRRKVEYRGVTPEEMDIDAVLARRPQLALVDELAHSNAPGSRHTKRYQDAVELLDAGVDVYTTLNVQHVESRADTVRQITGASIRETVPDSVLDGAEMEVVDLPPDELLKRLDEGKVCLPDRAEAAMMNFFRLGNLTTLREMALRLAAERVGQDVRDYMQAMQIAGPWKSGHRLLVAVSASPYSANLVRWRRRQADSLDCPWLAVHIERPEALTEEAQARLTHNLALARELGAEVITTADADVVRALLRVARQHNVTQIIVGKPGGLRLLERLRGATFLQRLIAASGDIDVNVVRVERADAGAKGPSFAPALEPQLRQYAIGVGAVALATALNAALDAFIGYYALALIYLLTVVALALFLARGPVFLAATLSALLWNFFFLPPRHTFAIRSVQDALMFGMYFAVALVLGQLTARIRAQERAERRREKRSTALYLLTRDLADAATVDELSQRLVAQVGREFERTVALLLGEADGNLARNPHPASTLAVTEKEQSVAAWAFRFARAAGRFTDNLPLSEALHLPLVTKQGAIGVLSVKLASDEPPTLEQRDLLDAFARQATLVLDRLRLAAEAEQARVVAESERLSKALLNSVSHELRTPIAAITTAASALDGIGPGGQPELARALTREIQTSTARLNRLVANLLDMTRLESGHVKPRLEWCDVRDLVNAAVNKTQKELAQHKVAVSLAPDLPLVKLDAVLMEQVLLNLLVNAACYTPPGTLVELAASAADQELSLSVADRGPGLPPDSVPHVFEKFYRVPGAPAGGAGLGLSIVKGFTEAQGGRAEAANREGGGAAPARRRGARPWPSRPRRPGRPQTSARMEPRAGLDPDRARGG